MKVAEVIAEIGCNHKGDIEVAKELINTAAIFCKASIVKFQKRTPALLLTEKEFHSPHPNPHNAYGSTYGEHREFLEFNLEQHKELKAHCEGAGIEYSCSVWDVDAAKEIISLSPKKIKIPSACNMNQALLDVLCEAFGGEIHLSLGMTTKAEEDEIVKYFEQRKRNQDLVLYACTSGYPVEFKDVSLMEIERLKKKFSSSIKAIGFSGHHLGISVDIAAFCIGAKYIERHFTLDRTWKGTDHAASLEPGGLRRLIRDIQAVKEAMTFKREDLLEVEKVQREKLKRNQMEWAKP